MLSAPLLVLLRAIGGKPGPNNGCLGRDGTGRLVRVPAGWRTGMPAAACRWTAAADSPANPVSRVLLRCFWKILKRHARPAGVSWSRGDAGFARRLTELRCAEWVVYAKRPFVAPGS